MSNESSYTPDEKNCCCCGQLTEPITKYDRTDHWLIGEVETGKGKVPVVSK